MSELVKASAPVYDEQGNQIEEDVRETLATKGYCGICHGWFPHSHWRPYHKKLADCVKK